MKYIFYTIALILLVGLNLGLFAPFAFFGTLPNLILLCIVVLAVIESDLYIILFVSLLGGLTWDIVTASSVGTYMLGYMLAATLIFTLSRRVFFIQDRVKYLSIFLIIFQVCISIWAFIIGWYGYRLHWSMTMVHPLYFFTHSGISLFYNLLLLYPLYIFVLAVDNVVNFFKRRRQIVS